MGIDVSKNFSGVSLKDGGRDIQPSPLIESFRNIIFAVISPNSPMEIIKKGWPCSPEWGHTWSYPRRFNDYPNSFAEFADDPVERPGKGRITIEIGDDDERTVWHMLDDCFEISSEGIGGSQLVEAVLNHQEIDMLGQ